LVCFGLRVERKLESEKRVVGAQEAALGVQKGLKQNSGQQRNIHFFPNLNQEVQVRGAVLCASELINVCYEF